MSLEDFLNEAYTDEASVAETVRSQLEVFKRNLNS
jgi:hypothetical protein